jgi:hypothetical protein
LTSLDFDGNNTDRGVTREHIVYLANSVLAWRLDGQRHRHRHYHDSDPPNREETEKFLSEANVMITFRWNSGNIYTVSESCNKLALRCLRGHLASLARRVSESTRCLAAVRDAIRENDRVMLQLALHAVFVDGHFVIAAHAHGLVTEAKIVCLVTLAMTVL